jgi:hypothetical protein
MKTTMTKSKRLLAVFLAVCAAAAMPMATRAADHGDGPTASNDQACDIADVFFFLDPNANDHVILIATFRGFIVPSEAANFGIYDPNVRYRFQVETTGNAKPDKFIDVTFSPKTSSSEAQTAKIKITGLGKFTALATLATLADTPNPPVITDLGSTGIKFFAGEVDDPFFFDIPAFNAVVKSIVVDHNPNPGLFSRARDSFAGYNIMSIALSVPKNLLLAGGTSNTLGLSFVTQRRTVETPGKNGETTSEGEFRNIDRMGNPAVNVALIPFAKKNKYNASTTQDDKDGKFVPVIKETVDAIVLGLGRSQADADAVLGALAGIAVLPRGDVLTLDTSLANAGMGGGTGANGFPNGRRLRDDTIDFYLTALAGGTLGDGVDANDVALRDEFPFLAEPQQPRANGVIDDNTRN